MMSDNTQKTIRTITGAIIVGMGMAGLYLNIEYSGWVLLIGFLMVIMIASISACDDPIHQVKWKQYDEQMTDVAGFEDCRMVAFKRTTGSDPIHVIRCPASSTGTQYSLRQGKIVRQFNNTVVDNTTEDDVHRAKIQTLENVIKQAHEELKKIKAE